MTRTEFDLQILRLKEVYGTNKYPSIRVEVFWQRLGGLAVALFRSAVDAMIAHSNHAPMLGEMEEALRGPLQDLAIEEKKRFLASCPPCVACEATPGMLFMHPASRPKHMGAVVYQCDCMRGPKLYPTFPKHGGGTQLQVRA